MKTCIKCKSYQTDENFREIKQGSKIKRMNTCKVCYKLICDNWKSKNKDKVNAYYKKYRRTEKGSKVVKDYNSNPENAKRTVETNKRLRKELADSYISRLLRVNGIPITPENMLKQRAKLLKMRIGSILRKLKKYEK